MILSRSPRLQPSPSLPNLRPSPRDREMTVPRHVTRPQPKSYNKLPPQPKDCTRCPKSSSAKTATSHYLTPPLTPSSSLQSDTTDHDTTDISTDLRRPTRSSPKGNQCSRFLIIGNAPSHLSEDSIGQYFPLVTAPSAWITSSPTRRLPSKPIQSTFRKSPDDRNFIVAFYDVRDAERAKRIIESKASKWLQDDGRAFSSTKIGYVAREEALTCRLVDSGHCADLLGDLPPSFMTKTEGAFSVSVKDVSPARDFSALRTQNQTHSTIPVKIMDIFEKHGDIRACNRTGEGDQGSTQIFLVEYFDVRVADMAKEALDGYVAGSLELRVLSGSSLRDHFSEVQKESSFSKECEIGGEHAAEPKSPTVSTYLSQQSQVTSNPAGLPFPVLNDIGAGGYYPEFEQPVCDSRVSSVEFQGRRRSAAGLDDLPSIHRGASTDNVTDDAIALGQYGRRSSNHLLFDSTGGRPHQKHIDADHSRKHSMYGHESEVGDVPNLVQAMADTHLDRQIYETESHRRAPFEVYQMQPPWVSSPPVPNPISMAMPYPAPPHSPMPPPYWGDWDPMSGGWVPFQEWRMYPPSHYYPQSHPPHHVAEYTIPYVIPSTSVQPGTVATRPPSLSHPLSRAPPEGNQLDLKKIEQGGDTRTTVMVKNIPNKMTDKELIAYINKVCPRRIDFLYLRMDFQNGCNVGYAFVNFISVRDLLRFAKARLNEKWNMYSSEKVLQMSYANYQGKEALVEKFKNSCIMDEREEWRPKIFRSEPGPNQGLPEEFPKPTHIRRKERSSYNRGTLYPPGVSTGVGHQRYLDAGSRPQPPPRAEDRRRRRGATEGAQFPSAETEDTALAG